MAWPCISRVCCLARFWNQFDKSDLSVPLTVQNYSNIGEQEIRSVTGHVFADRAVRTDQATPEHRHSPAAHNNGGRGCRANRRCTDQSYKPLQDAPFPSLTQYKQDYKPWPIPKKDNYPWISNGGGKGSPVNGSFSSKRPVNGSFSSKRPVNGSFSSKHPRTGKEEPVSRQGAQETSKTSSYRQEYRPWAGVQPSKPAQKKPTFLSITSSEPPPETSYQAAFSTDAHRHADSSVADITTHTQSNSLERAERVQAGSRQEEKLVKTKLSPNPSAVFQSKSRIFNI